MARKNDYTPERHVKLLFERQGGKCFVSKCRKPIHLEKPRDFVIEHENQLSISKSNALKNKTLRCKECANKKTNGTKATSYGSDTHARAKIKRIRGETCNGPTKKIQSRGFDKTKTRRFDGKVIAR